MGIIEERQRMIAAQPHLVTATGESVAVNIAEPKVQKLAVTFTPVQTGSGTPSPSNVRPISGWTDIAVQMCGKNLFDSAHADAAEQKIKNDSGTEVKDSGGSYTRLYTPVKPSTTYTVSAFTANNSKRVYFYTSEKAWISRTSSTTAMSITFTTPSNCFFVQFQSGSTVNEQWNIQLEVGSTATTYEPFRGISPSISLGGTYYGGTVDLVSGVMTVTWGNIASYAGETLTGRWLSSEDAYSAGGTPTTGAQVTYELATPQTVTLTPQTIVALRGQQNVTSPAGSVEIKYWTY